MDSVSREACKVPPGPDRRVLVLLSFGGGREIWVGVPLGGELGEPNLSRFCFDFLNENLLSPSLGRPGARRGQQGFRSGCEPHGVSPGVGAPLPDPLSCAPVPTEQGQMYLLHCCCFQPPSLGVHGQVQAWDLSGLLPATPCPMLPSEPVPPTLVLREQQGHGRAHKQTGLGPAHPGHTPSLPSGQPRTPSPVRRDPVNGRGRTSLSAIDSIRDLPGSSLLCHHLSLKGSP